MTLRSFYSRWAHTISFAGCILFLTLFMPAVQGCDKPIYPMEMVEVYPPYLFGLLCVFWGLAALSSAGAKVSRFVFYYTSLAALVWGFIVHKNLIKAETENVDLMLLFSLITWWIAALSLLSLGSALPLRSHADSPESSPRGSSKNLKKGSPEDPSDIHYFQEKRTSLTPRTVWTGALFCLSFFVPFMTAPHYYGLDLSFFSSLLIFFSGLIFEFFPIRLLKH